MTRLGLTLLLNKLYLLTSGRSEDIFGLGFTQPILSCHCEEKSWQIFGLYYITDRPHTFDVPNIQYYRTVTHCYIVRREFLSLIDINSESRMRVFLVQPATKCIRII